MEEVVRTMFIIMTNVEISLVLILPVLRNFVITSRCLAITRGIESFLERYLT